MRGYWLDGEVCPRFDGIGYGGFWQVIIFLVIISLAVLGVYLLVRKNRGNEALELLKLQYVKGEVTEEEYVNRKRVLTKK